MHFPKFLTASTALSSLAFLPVSYAWGPEGHEMVATIAHMFLHPSVLPSICGILNMSMSECHLAPIATWADTNKPQIPWSAPFHFAGALDDSPPQSCAFPGQRGWDGAKGVNVFDGIQNVTSLLRGWVNQEESDAVASEALKFLVHFLGDMHQPMHLTGRLRGGNLFKVTFAGELTNLHAVWDKYIINKTMLALPSNYSIPLPLPRIERALRGKAYDPYIRRIVSEGILDAWMDDITTWPSCPPSSAPKASITSTSGLTGLWQVAYSATTKAVQAYLQDGVDILPDGPLVCPYFWAQPTHHLACDIAWNTGDNFSGEVPELDTPEYAGVIMEERIIERVLAQGGVRLAKILNYIFAEEEEDGMQDFLLEM